MLLSEMRQKQKSLQRMSHRHLKKVFTIVQEYHSGRLPLYHFDVYRVDDIEEMYRIGYEEYFYGEGVCIVEWADIVEEIIPEDAKVIFIEYGEDEGERLYRCTF